MGGKGTVGCGEAATVSYGDLLVARLGTVGVRGRAWRSRTRNPGGLRQKAGRVPDPPLLLLLRAHPRVQRAGPLRSPAELGRGWKGSSEYGNAGHYSRRRGPTAAAPVTYPRAPARSVRLPRSSIRPAWAFGPSTATVRRLESGGVMPRRGPRQARGFPGLQVLDGMEPGFMYGAGEPPIAGRRGRARRGGPPGSGPVHRVFPARARRPKHGKDRLDRQYPT